MHTDELEIRNLVAMWLTASKAGDVDTVLGLMTDDVVFLVPGQPPMRGKSEFAKAQRAMRGASIQAKSEVQEVRVFGDWAYCWTSLTVVITPSGGAPVKRAGNTLSVLRKQAGAWALFRDANMLAVVSD